MPVLARKRTRILIAAAAVPLLLAMGAALISVLIGQSCSGGAGGDAPSRVAKRDIPASFLSIYVQAGARYGIPWEILAGIGKEECDHGRNPNPSCTPQPGATGPGVANLAGAAGPMQIGIGGAAGDAYDSLRRYLPCPALGPHDPPTAVELAALVLIKDKGARTGQPIDAYLPYVRAYNGTHRGRRAIAKYFAGGMCAAARAVDIEIVAALPAGDAIAAHWRMAAHSTNGHTVEAEGIDVLVVDGDGLIGRGRGILGSRRIARRAGRFLNG